MPGAEIHEGYRPGFVGKLTELHATYYSQIWDLGPQFESEIATGIAEFISRYDASQDGIWYIENSNGEIGGGIIIDSQNSTEEGAQLRYFLVDSGLQGEGYGRALLERALAFCNAQGYERTFLWTVDELETAIYLYGEYGFVSTDHVEIHRTWRTDIPYRLFERVMSTSEG